MAYHSEFDFVGGYDYEKAAGILHVADHHVAPGKKQWTWGCGLLGLGERDAAEDRFNEVLTLDVSHIGARLFKA